MNTTLLEDFELGPMFSEQLVDTNVVHPQNVREILSKH